MIYNIPSHRRGDTWAGIGSLTIFVNSSALNLQGSDIKMEFRQSIDSPVALTLSTQTSSIIINQTTLGLIQIPPKLIEIPFGEYFYDLQITFPNGVVKTYMSGTWEITPDITQ
jgi:hypothetical protein